MNKLGPARASDAWTSSGNLIAAAPAATAAWIGPAPRVERDVAAPAPTRRWKALLGSRSAVFGAVVLVGYLLLAVIGDRLDIPRAHLDR